MADPVGGVYDSSSTLDRTDPREPYDYRRCFLYLVPSHTFHGPWITTQERDRAQVLYRLGLVRSIWETSRLDNDEFGLLHPLHGIDTFSLTPDPLPDLDFSRKIRGVTFADAYLALLFHGLDHYKLNRRVAKIQFRFLIEPHHKLLRDLLEKAADQARLPFNAQPIRTLTLGQIVQETEPTKPL